MAPTHAAAYCCARRGCGGYRFVHLAVQHNEALECAKCGDRFPKRTQMMPLPRARRTPRDEAKGNGGKGDKNKGKGKGIDGNAKGGSKGGTTQARAKAKPKAKSASGPQPAPWERGPTPAESIHIDPKRRNDPTYCSTLQVLVAERLQMPDRAAAARETLAADRAKHEAELPPDRRVALLRKRLRAAEAAAAKQGVRVQTAEQDLVAANLTLHARDADATAGAQGRSTSRGRSKPRSCRSRPSPRRCALAS